METVVYFALLSRLITKEGPGSFDCKLNQALIWKVQTTLAFDKFQETLISIKSVFQVQVKNGFWFGIF